MTQWFPKQPRPQKTWLKWTPELAKVFELRRMAIVEFHRAGHSYRETAKQFGISGSRVSQIVKRAQA